MLLKRSKTERDKERGWGGAEKERERERENGHCLEKGDAVETQSTLCFWMHFLLQKIQGITFLHHWTFTIQWALVWHPTHIIWNGVPLPVNPYCTLIGAFRGKNRGMQMGGGRGGEGGRRTGRAGRGRKTNSYLLWTCMSSTVLDTEQASQYFSSHPLCKLQSRHESSPLRGEETAAQIRSHG